MAKDKTKNNAPSDKELLADENFMDFARRNYYAYSMAVIEDRAIPDFRDGMIPVARRILWSMHELSLRSTGKSVKAARTVGHVLGVYHPHGDSSVYGAMVNLTNRNTTFPFIHGDGNWGSMTSPRPAAMRYTEAKLNKIADEVMFNKFYTPIVDFSPNYDGSAKEPLILPATIPVLLIMGKEGMAPGARTYIPSCTTDSVLAVLKKAYSGEEIAPKMLYKTLRFTSTSGGIEVPPKGEEEKQARLSLFKSTKGSINLRSNTTWDEAKRTLTVDKFANHWSIEKLLSQILDLDAVAGALETTSKDDQYAVVKITLKKGLNPKLQENVLKHLEEKLLASKETYTLNFTERYIDETGQAQARLKPMSLTEFFTEWIEWRVQLEKRACAHWISEADKHIHRLEILLLACNSLEVIFKALKAKLSRQELDERIAKDLKIAVEDARVITDMRVYQLRALEADDIIRQKKDVEAKRKELKERRKDPMPALLEQVEKLLKE